MAEQGTHKPLVGGSNPPSATNPPSVEALAAALERGAAATGMADGARIVLAVSGGADSMALLHAAHAVGSVHAWQLSVAHLDHALRADSASDAEFVRAAAATLELPFVTQRADVAALAAAEGRSIEDAAREARYRFLEGLAPPGALIATAHTADDSAETILLNLGRGSGLSGVRGIPARRGRIVRPLLGERRSALRAALDAAGIGYRDDPSNDDPAHARNRVRHELIPALERASPGAVEALLRFSRLAAADDDLLLELAAAELAARRTEHGIDWRVPPSRALGRRIMRLAIGEPPPAARRIEALLDAAEGARGGVTIELGGGRSASVSGRVIRLS